MICQSGLQAAVASRLRNLSASPVIVAVKLIPSLKFSFTGFLVSFFFSSRRRHTRYWRDWSSDVCSSDLTARAGRQRAPRGVNREKILNEIGNRPGASAGEIANATKIKRNVVYTTVSKLKRDRKSVV